MKINNFDYKPPTDVRVIFPDISKAFHKMCHQGLCLNYKFYGVEGNLLVIYENYLDNRKQRVIIDVEFP